MVELVNEIGSFKFQATELIKDIDSTSHMALLQYIIQYGLRDTYPKIKIVMRIFITMPVSVTSCEQSFSKLKLINNYI